MSADELRLRRLLEALQDWQHVAKMKSLYRLGHNQALSEQLDPESLGGSRWLVEAHDGNEDLIRRGIISESDLKEKQNHRKEAVEKARKALDILDREGERGESLLESLEVDSSPLSDFLRHEKNRSATIALAVAAEKAIRRALARQNVGKIDGPEAKNPEGSGVLWQPASPVEKVGLKATGMDRRDAPESKPTPLTEDLPATLEGLLCWLSSRVQWLRSWHLSQDPKPIPPPFLEAIIRVCRGDPGVIPTEPEPLRCWANERIWRFSQLTLQQIHVCLENLGIYDSPLLRPINPLTDENCLVEVLDQLTALRAFVALRAGTFVVPRTPEPQGRSDAVPSVSPDTIVSLGDRVYMINGTRQVVNDTEDDVLQAYLGDENRPAVSRLTEPDLIKRSGVNDPMKVLRVLRNKYEELFKLALNPPQKKGAGWGVRIIRNAE